MLETHDPAMDEAALQDPRLDRAAGALVAAALLAGLPSSGAAPQPPPSRLPSLLKIVGEWLLTSPGEWDERVLGRAIAEAVQDRPHLDWPDQDLTFAVRQAAGRGHPTDDWFDASAAARSTAVGLLASLQVEQIADLARRSARVTHGSEAVQSAAALHAVAVMHVVRGLDPTPDLLLPALSAVVDSVLGVRLAIVGDLLRGDDPDTTDDGRHRPGALPWTRAMLASHEWVGTSPTDAVPAALYAFLRHPTDWRQARATALLLVDPDGDHAPAVKILGSLVGALVGAHVGVRRLDIGYGPVVPSLVGLAHRLAGLEA